MLCAASDFLSLATRGLGPICGLYAHPTSQSLALDSRIMFNVSGDAVCVHDDEEHHRLRQAVRNAVNHMRTPLRRLETRVLDTACTSKRPSSLRYCKRESLTRVNTLYSSTSSSYIQYPPAPCLNRHAQAEYKSNEMTRIFTLLHFKERNGVFRHVVR